MRVDSLKGILARLDSIERDIKADGFLSVRDELNKIMLNLREQDFTHATLEERRFLRSIFIAISRLTNVLLEERTELNGKQASKMKEQSQLRAYHRQA